MSTQAPYRLFLVPATTMPGLLVILLLPVAGEVRPLCWLASAN